MKNALSSGGETLISHADGRVSGPLNWCPGTRDHAGPDPMSIGKNNLFGNRPLDCGRARCNSLSTLTDSASGFDFYSPVVGAALLVLWVLKPTGEERPDTPLLCPPLPHRAENGCFTCPPVAFNRCVVRNCSFRLGRRRCYEEVLHSLGRDMGRHCLLERDSRFCRQYSAAEGADQAWNERQQREGHQRLFLLYRYSWFLGEGL